MFLKKVHTSNESHHKTLAQASDDELMTQLTEASYEAIVNEIFNRYSHLLYGLCFKYLKNTEESKDAVQSIFEKIFVDLRNHNVRNLKSWLLIVSKNYCLMQIRKKHLQTSELTNENSSIVLLKLYHEEVGQRAEEDEKEKLIEEMLSCIDKLCRQQSVCLNLMYLNDKSYKEISDITGFTLNEVKSHIQNGKRNLRKLLIENNG